VTKRKIHIAKKPTAEINCLGFFEVTKMIQIILPVMTATIRILK